MEVAYYYDKNLGFCPVKKYLEKYLPNSKDNYSRISKKEKILLGIRRKILFIKQNNGISDGAISKSIHGYNFFSDKSR